MHFENQDISFKPKPLFENKELQKKLLAKKEQIVDAFRPKETDFSDIYPVEEINADLKEIEYLQSLWKGRSEHEEYLKNVSSIYEGIVADQIDANAWLGDNCEAVAASLFDDIKHGVDVVGIFTQNETKQHIGLGIDVTFASDKKILEKKLDSIKSCIRNKTLPFLKYFQDPETGEHKQIFLPKIIIGSRLSSAEKLIQLWGGNDTDRNKKLSQHPISSKIILESLAQLQYFYEYASGLAENVKVSAPQDSEDYEKIAREYAKMYNMFYDIYIQKKELIESHLNEVSDDIVYETIYQYTQKGDQV